MPKPPLDPHIPRHIPCTMDEYHARAEWSNSQISDFINPERGPLYFHGAHFCNPPLWPREQKAVFDFGTAVHQLLSSPGKMEDVATEIPSKVLNAAGHKKGKPWTEWSEEHAGLIQLKAEEIVAARAMVRRVYEHPVAKSLLEHVLHYEHTLVWRDEETGLDLRSRCDLACGIQTSLVLVDAKSARSVDTRKFAWSVRDYGYHRQGAFYTRPWRLLKYDVPTFVFLALSKTPPYPCRVFELDEAALAAGDAEISEALTDLAQRIEAHGDRPQQDNTAWLSPLDTESTVVALP